MGDRVTAIDAGQQFAGAQARQQPQAAQQFSPADMREIWLLLILVFGGLASESTINVLMPLAADAGGASYAWVGVLSGASRLVLVLLLIPGTWLVRRWGRRIAVVIGAALQGAAALTYALVPDVHWMLLPQIMLGTGLSLFWPAYLSYFAEVTAAATHRMQTRRSLSQGVALLVTPVLGTYLAGRLGYGAGFAVIGAMTVAVALVCLRLTSPAGRPTWATGSPVAFLGTYRSAGALFRRRAFLLVMGLSVVGSLLIYLVSSAFLTLHLRRLGFAGLTIGTLISLRSLSDVALRAAFVRLAVRFRPLYLMAFATAGVAFVYLLLPFVTLPAAVVALMVLLGVLGSQYDPATVTVMSNMLPSSERDVGVAVWTTINSLAAWAVAPLLGGFADAAGLPAAFLVCGCAGLVAVGALVRWGRSAAGRTGAPAELTEMYG